MIRLDKIGLSQNLTKIRAEKAGFPAEAQGMTYRFVLWAIDEDDNGKPVRFVEDIVEMERFYLRYFNRVREQWAGFEVTFEAWVTADGRKAA